MVQFKIIPSLISFSPPQKKQNKKNKKKTNKKNLAYHRKLAEIGLTSRSYRVTRPVNLNSSQISEQSNQNQFMRNKLTSPPPQKKKKKKKSN